jgi:hypothetical protein
VVRAGLTLRLESVDEVFRALLVLGGAHPAGGVARSFSSLLLSLRTRERAQVLVAWAGRGPKVRLEKALEGKKPKRGSAARLGQPGMGRNGLAEGSRFRSR